MMIKQRLAKWITSSFHEAAPSFLPEGAALQRSTLLEIAPQLNQL
jgi:hypothetical protein